MIIQLEVIYDETKPEGESTYTYFPITKEDFEMEKQMWVDVMVMPMATQLYWAVREKLGLPSHQEVVAAKIAEAIVLRDGYK